MRQLLLFCLAFFALCRSSGAQDISVRVRQVAFSSVDPDGAGPARGSVTFRFELKSSSTEVLADGMGLSVAYQSANLIATPTNTVTKLGPINTAMWTQQVDNRTGNPITPVTYGGQSFDKRMIITFNQNIGVPDAIISSAWTAVAELTYYTLNSGQPQGGYIVPEPASVVAQNELSSDGGLTTYPYLSPEAATPLALGGANAPLPVRFLSVEAQCSPTATALTWRTASEKDSHYFEVEKSSDGNTWNSIGRVAGAGNSNDVRTYQFTDNGGGAAQYRIRQVDADGTVTYSVIVRTTCGSSSLYVNLYPVPAKDKLTLVIGFDKVVTTTVSVVDNSGRTVMRVPVAINKGTNSFTLDVSRLPQGQYYLQSEGEDVKLQRRFIISR